MGAVWPRCCRRGLGQGRPPKDHRLILDALLWLARTGAPWRDLPERFGPWRTVATRFYRWTRSRGGFGGELHVRCDRLEAALAVAHKGWLERVMEACGGRG